LQEGSVTDFIDESVEELSEAGSVGHLGSDEPSVSNKWYMPRNDWLPIWENNRVVGFCVGKTGVPGAFEIEDTGTGIRWRYDLGSSSEAVDSYSDRLRSTTAFKTFSNLLVQNLDGVGVSMHNVGGG